MLAAGCILSGCFSAQQLRERRIAANQQLFNSFSPAIQKQVRLGYVDVGFSQDMVRLAWGKPHRVFSRRTREGETTVWEYTRTVLYARPEHMSVPVHITDRKGRIVTVYRSVWFDRETEEEYTVARVEFVRGRVIAIERLNL